MGQSDSAQPVTQPVLLGFATCFQGHKHLLKVSNEYHHSLLISILPASELSEVDLATPNDCS